MKCRVCLFVSAENADLKKNDTEEQGTDRRCLGNFTVNSTRVNTMLNRIVRIFQFIETLWVMFLVFLVLIIVFELYVFREVVQSRLPTNQINRVLDVITFQRIPN